MRFKWVFLAVIYLLGLSIKVFPQNKSAVLHFRHASVVSASIDASNAGVQILKKGGSVVDAAITVQFALAVVFPPAGNIGGGGFMMVRLAPHKNLDSVHYYSLDYRETAPKLARKDMYLDSLGQVVEGLSTDGNLASGIPGVVDGMVRAHKRFGKLPWKELLKPAIRLARTGFILSREMASSLNEERVRFLKLNGPHCPFIKSKGNWKAGELLIQPDLARTLTLISQKGRSGFYEGETAKKLVEQMNRTYNSNRALSKGPINGPTKLNEKGSGKGIEKGLTKGKEKGQTKEFNPKGLIGKEDLLRYEAVWRDPIYQNYKDYKIIAMPPPSSGGLALFQLLSLTENYPIQSYGWESTAYMHLLIEAERRVYADRSYYLGDPDFVNIPMEDLISKNYLKTRFLDFDSSKATPSAQIDPGKIAGYETMSKHLKKESEETTHFSIADSKGNAVSVTTTLNDSYGSGTLVKGAGFILNNEMDDFSIKPGVPNVYGLLGGDANAIHPGKRMLSSMTPTLVDSGGKLYMVVGSPGGATIITTVLQTILNVLDFKMNMQEAVKAPRFHSQWLPDYIYLESGGFSNQRQKALQAMGHTILLRGSIGRCDAIRINKGELEPGADPRGNDRAAGY